MPSLKITSSKFLGENNLYAAKGKTIGPYTDKKLSLPPKRTSGNDLEPFKRFITNIKNAFMEQSHVIVQVFPEEMDMFYLFVDRALEDVVSWVQ